MWTKLTPELHHDTNPHFVTSNATHITSICRSYYLEFSPPQHNSDPNTDTDTASYSIYHNQHTQTFN